MPGRLVARVDANPRIGTGHAMRLLALAEAWGARNGDILVLTRGLPDGIRQRYQDVGADVERIPEHIGPGAAEAEHVAAQANVVGASWVVLDGYDFDGAYQARIRDPPAGRRVLAFDDGGRLDGHTADLIVDQNAGANGDRYPDLSPHTRLLAGSAHVVLRKAIRDAGREARTDEAIVDRAHGPLLVTLGGAPPERLLEQTLAMVDRSAAQAKQTVAVTVLTGVDHNQAIDTTAFEHLRIQTAGGDDEVASALASARFAIAAGGTTVWELCHLAVPVIVGAIADNQAVVSEAIGSSSAGIDIGMLDPMDPRRFQEALARWLVHPDGEHARRRAAEHARELVDGAGIQRIIDRMEAMTIQIRPAEAEDEQPLWAWANDPDTRAASFHSDPIPWESHRAWFRARTTSPDASLLMAIHPALGAGPYATVRFEAAEDDDRARLRDLGVDEAIAGQSGSELAVVSVNMRPDARGTGLGAPTILAGCLDHRARRASTILAYIRPGNEASQRAFARAGFMLVGAVDLDASPARLYLFPPLERPLP